MSKSTPDRTPAGWPYLTGQHYIDVIGQYTVELANKLQNSDADVAAAINAADQAQQAADEALAHKAIVEDFVAGDTEWNTLTLLEGFAGSYAPKWRIKGGVVYWRGRVTRLAGNWPASFTEFAVVPPAARPDEGLLYLPAMDRGAKTMSVAVSTTLQVASGAATAEIELGSLPPYIATGR